MAGHRQIVETSIGQLLIAGGLERSRPHELTGALARVAAAVCWHNAGIWLNRWLGRPALMRVDMAGWDS